MGQVCCCCRKEENENKDKEEEKQKNHEPLVEENPSSPTKPNTNKSIEVETLGNNEKEGDALPENEKVPEAIAPIRLSTINNVEEIKSCREFFIKIWIETLEITYKLCDDFGNFFKPFVEVIFDKQSKVLNTMDEEKLNLSNISENADVNISYNANIPIGHKKSGMNSQILPKERFYYFKSSVDFNGNDETRFSSLLFYVKNENTHGHLKILPAIVIGQIRIPISLLLNQKDKSFDGYISLKLRDLIEIGQIKVKIQCGSDINLNNSISILASEGNNFGKDNFNLLKNNVIEDNSMDYSFNNIKSNLFWEVNAINYTEIDSKIIDKYFFTELNIEAKLSIFKVKSEQFSEANKIINDKVFNPEALFKFYIDAIREENIVLLYEIFNQLLKMSYQQDFVTINEFLKLLSDQENENFYKIYEFCFNAYLMKNFLIILNELIKNNKKFKVLNSSMMNTSINRFPKDDLLIEIVFNIIKRVNDLVKKQILIHDYVIELRDVLVWSLNVLNELLTVSDSKNDETRKQEYTASYNNSISIMSQRIHFLRIIESHIDDTPLISSLCRVMRKATQNITFENSSLLDRSQIPGRPRDISKQFKILMIEKYNGLFMHSLNVILHKYQHYSELHYNILIIIYQIINSLECKHLIDAGNKLGLVDFKDNFSIYRGKIKTFSKMLNNLHLNILYMFTEINKTNMNDFDPNLKAMGNEIIKHVLNDLKSFYRETKTNKKRIEDFKAHKYNEIDIHEIISRIFCNLTRSEEGLNMIGYEDSIIEDIFEYLIRISNIRKDVSLVKTHMENQTKKKRNIQEICKVFLSIIDNSLLGIKSLIEAESLDYYKNFLIILEKKFTNYDNFVDIFSSIESVMIENNINSNKFKNTINSITETLGKFWNS